MYSALYGVIILQICQHLNFAEKFALRLVCRNYYKPLRNLNDKFQDELLNRIEEYFIPGKENAKIFLQIFKNKKHYMFGGFVASVLYGFKLVRPDLDIGFLDIHADEDLHNLMKSYINYVVKSKYKEPGFKLKDEESDMIWQTHVKVGPEVKRSKEDNNELNLPLCTVKKRYRSVEYGTLNILSRSTIEAYNRSNIDLIQFKRENFTSFQNALEKSGDFDFLKIIYDGKLRILNEDAVFTRSCRMSIASLYTNYSTRSIEPNCLMLQLLMKIQVRRIKYEARGNFNIQIIDEESIINDNKRDILMLKGWSARGCRRREYKCIVSPYTGQKLILTWKEPSPWHWKRIDKSNQPQD